MTVLGDELSIDGEEWTSGNEQLREAAQAISDLAYRRRAYEPDLELYLAIEVATALHPSRIDMTKYTAPAVEPDVIY